MIFVQLLAALVPTFLISRLMLWLLKRWNGRYLRYIATHAISGALAVVLAAYGFADGGSPDWDAGLVYLMAQTFWLGVDLLAFRGRSRQVVKQDVA